MIFVRRVDIQSIQVESSDYQYLVFDGEAIDSEFLHRVFGGGAFELLGSLRQAHLGFAHVRGHFVGDKAEWERFVSHCPDALSCQCRFEHLDQEFCVEAKLSDFGLLPSVPLEAFGDYAFGLTPDRISAPERSWNPREVVGGDGSVELIELAWEGAFEAHGLCTSLDLDAVRFPKGVIYRSEPVVLSASDVTLHGRSGRELFDR